LISNGKLVSLDLSNCFIGEDGICALSSALAKDSSLRVLNLCLNRIGEKGAKELSEALKNSKLTELSLTRKCIAGNGENLLRQAVEGREIQLRIEEDPKGKDLEK